jgi:hypothetical protein
METKPWYKSQTILSILGIVISSVAPKYTDLISPMVGNIGEIIFGISAIYGRRNATKQVTLTNQNK